MMDSVSIYLELHRLKADSYTVTEGNNYFIVRIEYIHGKAIQYLIGLGFKKIKEYKEGVTYFVELRYGRRKANEATKSSGKKTLKRITQRPLLNKSR